LSSIESPVATDYKLFARWNLAPISARERLAHATEQLTQRSWSRLRSCWPCSGERKSFHRLAYVSELRSLDHIARSWFHLSTTTRLRNHIAAARFPLAQWMRADCLAPWPPWENYRPQRVGWIWLGGRWTKLTPAALTAAASPSRSAPCSVG